jgi:DNA-directed RNA polymerase specialized sigma24 family protein
LPLHPSPDQPDSGFEPQDDEPTPQEALAVKELLTELLDSLKTERQRDVVLLYLEGVEPKVISSRLGVSERTVYRDIEAFEERVEELSRRERAQEE